MDTFWRLAKGGHKILFSGELTAAHHHRRSFRKLVKEYRQSAHGCAHFIRRHSDSPLARKRHLQAFGLPAAALGFLAATVGAVMAGHAMAVVAVIAAAFVVVTVREAIRSRALEAVTYPPATLALGWVYTTQLAGGLLFAVTETAPRARDLQSGQPLRHRRGTPNYWPLVAIIVLQAGLSISLIWSNTAFGDEALYLRAGHMQLAHWLSGRPLPNFNSYFSGAPQLYPPLGAAIDSVAGLAGARMLSLAFMLVSTAMLYFTAIRLFSRATALTAVILWALSEPCIRLAYATYDAMSVMCVAIAMYICIRAATAPKRGEVVAVAAIVMAFGNVIAYSSLVIDPIVIIAALCAWQSGMGRRSAIQAAAWMAGAVMMLTSVFFTLLKLWQGVFFTVLDRQLNDHQPLTMVLEGAWSTAGLIMVLAASAIGFVIMHMTHRPALLSVLSVSIFVVPLAQLHAQTAWSLDKHMAYGAWLSAMAAGVWGEKLVHNVRFSQGWLAVIAVMICTAYPAVQGWEGARSEFLAWPNASQAVAELQLAADNTSGSLYAGGSGYLNSVDPYYLRGDDFARWDENDLQPDATISPQAIRSTQRQLAAYNYSVVILGYSTDFTTASLSGSELLEGSPRGIQQELLQLASVGSQTPGLPELTRALESDHAYRIFAIGQLDSQHSRGVFAIWRRTAKDK